MLSDLNKSFTDPALREQLLLASYIDPRFKMLPFLNTLERIGHQSSLITLAYSIYKSLAQHTVKVKIEPADKTQQSKDTDPPLPVLDQNATLKLKSEDEPVAKRSALDSV